MILTTKQVEELKDAAKPLVAWLMANCHLNCRVIVDSTGAEVVETLAAIVSAPHYEPPDKEKKPLVIVNGLPFEIDANQYTPLAVLKACALEKYRPMNEWVKPPEDWELKDSAGVLLDMKKTLGDVTEQCHQAMPNLERPALFLCLKAGVGA